MRYPKMLPIFCCTVFPILGAALLLVLFGFANVSVYGFALDSQNTLYVGVSSRIEVYHGKELLYTIDSHSRENYAFTIINDTILLSNANKIYYMDLCGNVLSKEDDAGTKTFNKLQYNKHVFVASDGDVYIMRFNMGRTKIVSRDGTILYHMPLIDYLVKLVLIASFLSIFICVPIILVKWIKLCPEKFKVFTSSREL